MVIEVTGIGSLNLGTWDLDLGTFGYPTAAFAEIFANREYGMQHAGHQKVQSVGLLRESRR